MGLLNLSIPSRLFFITRQGPKHRNQFGIRAAAKKIAHPACQYGILRCSIPICMTHICKSKGYRHVDLKPGNCPPDEYPNGPQRDDVGVFQSEQSGLAISG